MIYDLIILGGGPAGIAAGIYAARKKIKTLLITDTFGGQSVIAGEIKNFIGFKSISGIEMAKKLEEHLRAQEGVEIKDGRKVSAIEKQNENFLVKTNKEEFFESKTILIALGSHYRRLKIPGEKEFEGKGVFYCSICDAPLMKNKTAIVVGGGNSGFDAVTDLLPYASKIYLLEFSNALKGDPITLEKLKASGKLEIITMVNAKEIIGDNFVSALKYEDLKTGEIKEIKTDGVFAAIGYESNTDLVKNLTEINKEGKIIVNCKTQKTSHEGVWAAGDATDVLYNQINIAIGDAIKAALNIYEYLKK
ncbi:MAG: FAD-dependent oxidoreductase [bacterium]|nr:FAD-dependent oxidoreductase [bacterium]